jgi:hypothetical protein
LNFILIILLRFDKLYLFCLQLINIIILYTKACFNSISPLAFVAVVLLYVNIFFIFILGQLSKIVVSIVSIKLI